jgi:hypothetical protein
MKQQLLAAYRSMGNLYAQKLVNIPVAFVVIILFLSSCTKEKINNVAAPASRTDALMESQANTVNGYTNLPLKTAVELKRARAATARYRNFENAIKDGYSNIMVDVENMGHHYMKTSIVDDKFDISEPEILVYNRDESGNPELVAVEYAVPLTYPKPGGFTGSLDVWNDTSGFPLWLLHAWVWHYNPEGVFNWTNPDVELH